MFKTSIHLNLKELRIMRSVLPVLIRVLTSHKALRVQELPVVHYDHQAEAKLFTWVGEQTGGWSRKHPMSGPRAMFCFVLIGQPLYIPCSPFHGLSKFLRMGGRNGHAKCHTIIFCSLYLQILFRGTMSQLLNYHRKWYVLCKSKLLSFISQ